MTFFWNNPNSKYFLAINTRFRKLIWKMKRKKLKNKEFTIVTDNCMAGLICSDLCVDFNTPFLNGGVTTSDFIKMLKD